MILCTRVVSASGVNRGRSIDFRKSSGFALIFSAVVLQEPSPARAKIVSTTHRRCLALIDVEVTILAHRLSLAEPVVNCALLAPQYSVGGGGGEAGVPVYQPSRIDAFNLIIFISIKILKA
jgi:hypothetical protein